MPAACEFGPGTGGGGECCFRLIGAELRHGEVEGKLGDGGKVIARFGLFQRLGKLQHRFRRPVEFISRATGLFVTVERLVLRRADGLLR